MARDLLVSVRIGAALSGTFRTAFDSARGTSLRLGQVADDLRGRHARLGEIMARAMSHPTRNVGELRRQYERLGQTIEQLRIRQERLAASMARGQALRAERGDLRGQAMETAGTALALGAPVMQSVRLAAGYQDQIKDIAITGEFSPAEEARLGTALRQSALKWNQTQSEVARGTAVLVAGGIQDAKALEKYASVMAKGATGTRASMDDLGSVIIALKDNLKIGEEGFEGALNMLIYSGKRGQFEVKDMAKWLPTLTPTFQALGVTGKEAVAELGAALQIARKGAGSNDEAANNFKNFIQKITAPDTLKDFEKAGIDLKRSMMNLRAEGMTPVQAMLEVITKYMTTKGPDAAAQFQKAMTLKDGKEREAALARLAEAYKLGDLFQDMQAMAFIRPAIANQAEMKDIKDGSMAAADKGLLDKDFERRMEGANEKFKEFKIGISDIGISIGDALLPSLVDLVNEVRPSIQAFSTWSKEHPGVIKGVVGLVGGLLAGKLAFVGLKYGINLVLSPFNSLGTGIRTVSDKWTILMTLWRTGQFAPVISRLRGVGGGIMSVTRILLPFGRGLLMAFGSPFMLAGQGIWFVSKLLAGNLLTGLRLAGQAFLWMARAMLMNPIGLAITAIAGGAYLIYRNWSTIKPWFLGLWGEVKAAFSGGIGGVMRLLVNWSPMGLLYKAFAGAMKLFGIELPKTFTDFGGMLIDGLVGGITAKLGAAKGAIIGFGSSIKDWFASTLGIRSPSRVFLGYGDNIAQGAALGIGRSAALAGQAAAGMALATTVAWGQPLLPPPLLQRSSPEVLPFGAAVGSVAGPRQTPVLPAPMGRLRLPGGPLPDSSVTEAQPQLELAQRLNEARAAVPPAAAGAVASPMVVHFSPQITVQGGDPAAAREEVSKALQLSYPEFERMMKRYQHEKSRTSYGRSN